ncbi:MAG: CYTH domain-containing protein [Azoarcus sp.]|jgi:adenylate cyclase|nr:CYTH domain-containing protein [Azoarcus sp.]
MAIEIELKLSFPAEALPEIMRHPLIAGAPREGEPDTLDSTYFDTSALTLKAHGVGLRLRRQAGEMVQTVKCSAQTINGLTRRPEWESPWRGHFDFSTVTDAAVATLLTGVRDELVPVFTVRFLRDTRRIQPRPGVCVFAMIDTGLIEAGECNTQFHELELELVEGDDNELVRIAEKLREALPLAFENVSKAQRGYRLAELRSLKLTPCNKRNFAAS